MNCKKCGNYAHGGTDGADHCDDCARTELYDELTRLRLIVARVENAKLIEGIIRGTRLRGGTIDDEARAVRDYVMREG